MDKLPTKVVTQPDSELEKRLTEAINQPGIKVALDVLEAAERFTAPVVQLNDYFHWQSYPICYNSADAGYPA